MQECKILLRLANGVNALADWLAVHVTVTGNRSDFLLLGHLLDVFKGDKSADKPAHVAPSMFVGLAKAYFAACGGAAMPPLARVPEAPLVPLVKSVTAPLRCTT